ncbi:MAG: hypothetical protein JST86_13635 [Bacteroidetes bacterium]|nr:hypothetical protein [Bacteroidota bacterium]
MPPSSVYKVWVCCSIAAMMTFSSAAQHNNRPLIDSTVYTIIKVKPSVTDPSVTHWDSVHVAYYNPKNKAGKLLLWLTGTGGSTNNMPAAFFNTALEQGYRIIALSFISVPAVSQTCMGNTLNNMPDCAAAFRLKRVYGTGDFSLIDDQPQDAIIPRLTKLLVYLQQHDAGGNWATYLTHTQQPNWPLIAIAGQSQGGGMAEFIAQRENIARVISFSGGWDYSNSTAKTIAGWYYHNSVTPMDKWFATYHVNEKAAASIREICSALKIPADHVFALNLPLANAHAAANGNPYHGDGIRNIAYQPTWITMLGNGQ